MADVKISQLPTKTIASTDLVPVVDAAATTTSRVTAGAIAGLVTDASQLTAGTLNDSRLSANVVLTNDARLSDARTPTSHTHAIGDVTGLQTALDAKQSSGSYAAATHTHSPSDLTQASATTNQVLAWSGSAWAPATVAYASISGTPTLATVATSGSYNDLTDKPTIAQGLSLGAVWALS